MNTGVGSLDGVPPGKRLIERLRGLVPEWRTSMRDAKRLAETQAWVLLADAEVDQPPVPSRVIECFPEIAVSHREGMEHSGRVSFDGKRWVIELSADETPERRRMTLFHELKHVIDDPLDEVIYQGDSKRREKVADYFAAQVLIPKPWLKYDVTSGITDPGHLARRYCVSRAAMDAQLEEIGASALAANHRKEER